MQYGFGVDIGGTTVKIACFDRKGGLLSKWEIPTRREDGGGKILPDIAAAITAFIQERGLSRQQMVETRVIDGVEYAVYELNGRES